MGAPSVRFDCSALNDTIEQFSALLPQLSDASLEVVNAFVDAVNSGEKPVFVQRDYGGASQAGQAVVCLYPSDAFAGLLAALGAGNG